MILRHSNSGSTEAVMFQPSLSISWQFTRKPTIYKQEGRPMPSRQRTDKLDWNMLHMTPYIQDFASSVFPFMVT